MANTHSKLDSVAWHNLNWRKIQKVVYKLQTKIYQASVNGNIKKVRQLQKTLLNSYSAKLLAVRKITQDNSGKKTAGVDRIKSLTPPMRLKLAQSLKVTEKAKPVRRVWIPKPNGEKRPLGIPTIHDRAVQTLVKMALEPEWEAKFEPNSYGFRPGRSAHDAIEAIFNSICKKSKFVLDADIAKCFDRINHSKLLEKLNTYPKLRKQIKAWLKAGILDNGKTIFPEEGTPQGGALSPLLANIALHGMEELIKKYAATWKGNKRDNKQSLNLIRYADDFVVIHEKQEVIENCKKLLQEWLIQIGLELKEEKTQITHTLKGGNPGFNFLGFNIRQYKVGKYHSGKDGHGGIMGFKTIIKPSKESVKKHYDNLAKIVDSHKTKTQKELIEKLNPIIKGWANYYKSVCSKETFTKLDHLLFKKIWSWANRRHARKNKKWVKNKYWHTRGQNTWTFCNKETTLAEHAKVMIQKHTKVIGTKTPYDGDNIYWGKRLREHPTLHKQKSNLLKAQRGKCNWCKLNFIQGDKIEVDHIIPTKIKRDNTYNNLQLLHKHCHDAKTRQDLIYIKKYRDSRAEQKSRNKVIGMNWKWIDDMLVSLENGTHTEPIQRGAE